MKELLVCAGTLVCLAGTVIAQTTNTNLPGWITRPLSLTDCLNLALQQNAALLKARSDLEASQGVVVQTRAIALPKLQAAGQYRRTDRNAIESIPAPGIQPLPDQNWSAGVQIVQAHRTRSLRSAGWQFPSLKPPAPHDIGLASNPGYT